MENSYEPANGNGFSENGERTVRYSLSWLDVRVFYVRVSKCEIDDSTPKYLTLNHVPLNRDTLLEVNGARGSIYSDGVSTLLRRDRLDRKSEEATFVSTDGVRMTGSVKFEVFDKDVLVLSGVLEIPNCNGFTGELKNNSQRWSMNCELETVPGTGFLKGKQYMGGPRSASPAIEVYVAGCFAGTPIILTKTLQLNPRKKQLRKGILDSIPEYDATECQKDETDGLLWQVFSDGIISNTVMPSCYC